MRKERREEAVGILPHSSVSTFSGRTEDDGSLRKTMGRARVYWRSGEDEHALEK
jgi:hypothetical protein